MTVQTVTVHLPDVLYHQIEQRARQMDRSVEAEVVALVASALPTFDDLPADVAGELAQLTFLTDDELWEVATTTLTSDESERMEALLLKQQREGMTPEEEQEAQRLLQRYDRTMLVRAQAAVLLKERGHDISPLRDLPSAS